MIKNWKKSAVVALAALTLTGGMAVPAMAHGHGYGHHSSYSQTHCYGQNSEKDCEYHGQNCDGNCEYRNQNYSKKKNAKQKGYYCEYHDKTHKKKSSCKNYCKKHKTIHANGKRHKHHSSTHH